MSSPDLSLKLPRRQNVTTSKVGLKKKRVTYAKISQKIVNPREIAGNVEEEEVTQTDPKGVTERREAGRTNMVEKKNTDSSCGFHYKTGSHFHTLLGSIIKDSRPERYISSMLYSPDIPSWSRTLAIITKAGMSTQHTSGLLVAFTATLPPWNHNQFLYTNCITVRLHMA